MKTLITVLAVISINLANEKDSILTRPFGMDLTKEINYVDLIKSIGIPGDIFDITMDFPINKSNIVYCYPNFRCYLRVNDSIETAENPNVAILYAIEVTKGCINNLKIGTSKTKISEKYGMPHYKTQNYFEYIVLTKDYKFSLVLKFKKDKLEEIKIIKSSINLI